MTNIIFVPCSMLCKALRTSIAIVAVFGLSDTLAIADPVVKQTVSKGHPAAAKTQKFKRTDTDADRRIAAEGFVEYVNSARMALATKQPELAKEYINLAQQAASALKAGTKNSRVTGIQSSRITYNHDTDYKNHYFPIAAGPLKVKNIESGPFWSNSKGTAVTDAELVYLTINLGKADVAGRLSRAVATINKGDVRRADTELAKLGQEVITVDSTLTLPLEKARDNLALAKNFIQAKNYTGARYTLSHARDALDAMEDSAQYTEQKDRILGMRTNLVLLQDKIARNDPTAIEKAEQMIEGWWSELKAWSTPAAK